MSLKSDQLEILLGVYRNKATFLNLALFYLVFFSPSLFIMLPNSVAKFHSKRLYSIDSIPFKYPRVETTCHFLTLFSEIDFPFGTVV